MDPNTEIRKLKPAELYTLASILASSESWKALSAVVPKEGTKNVLKFNTEHITLIERASCQQRKSGAEIFLEEWSTMGKQRPTLSSTLDLLVRAQLFRAADYVAVDLLKQQPPGRPTSGPAAPIDISDEELANLRNRGSSEFGMSDSHVFGSKESLHTSSTSLSGNESHSVSDISSKLELQTNELPAFVADIGRGSTSVYDNRNELRSSELPQFVAELAN